MGIHIGIECFSLSSAMKLSKVVYAPTSELVRNHVLSYASDDEL